MKIRRSALERGIKLYEMAIWKFMGNSIITNLNNETIIGSKSLSDGLSKESKAGSGKWIDLSGLICPAEVVDKLLSDIETGNLSTMEEVEAVLNSIHTNYYNYEWTWVYDELEKFYGKKFVDFTPEDVIAIVKKWKESVLGIDSYLYEDAKREFSSDVMTGFGVDGDEDAQVSDFKSVRGELKDNEMVQEIEAHIRKKSSLGDRVIEQMQELMKQT